MSDQRPYYDKQALDRLSKEFRTVKMDSEGDQTEEITDKYARGVVLKLIHNVRHADSEVQRLREAMQKASVMLLSGRYDSTRWAARRELENALSPQKGEPPK